MDFITWYHHMKEKVLSVLVDDWKNGWKWVSTQCFVGVGILQATWKTIPEDWKMSMPQDMLFYATIALVVMGIVGRFIDQKLKVPDATEPNKNPD